MIPVGDDAPLARRPVVTYALVLTNVLVLGYLAGRSGYPDVVHSYGFVPGAANMTRFLAALFLPGTLLHLLFNGLYLIGIGRTVEDTIGRPAYLLYYLVGGAIALGFYFVVHPDGRIPIVAVAAATGAILAGYVVLFPKANIRFVYWAWYWEGSFFVPAWLCIGLWAVVELVMGWQTFSMSHAYPFGHWAALTGLAAGALIALPIRILAGRLAGQFADDDIDAEDLMRMPAVVQQQAQAQRRGESTESGEIQQDKGQQWAEAIATQLNDGHQSKAIRLFERHSDRHSLEKLQPAVQYELAEACLGKGRYWRAATILEHVLAGAAPPKMQARAHALLAALYGEHPYFHESATPHLDLAMATLPRNSRARGLLHEVEKKVDAARRRELTVGERDRFCLVRETAESYRIAEAGPIIAKATRADLKQVMQDLRNSPGVLAWKLPRKQAFDLGAALSHAGIHVGLVPLQALTRYGRTEPLEHVGVKPQGIQLRTAGETLKVPWSNVALVAGGFLVLTTAQQQRVYEEAREAALVSGDAMQSFDSMTRELRHITLLDFWLKDPPRHLRVREHPLRMPEHQIQSVASAILREAPTVPKNGGLNAVASGVVPPDCLFDGRDYFTYHGVWHMYLFDWDELPAVSDSLIHNLITELRDGL